MNFITFSTFRRSNNLCHEEHYTNLCNLPKKCVYSLKIENLANLIGQLGECKPKTFWINFLEASYSSSWGFKVFIMLWCFYIPDDQRLMTFLRGCSFSLEKCKRKLDMYFTMRAAAPEFFTNRDVNKQPLRNVIANKV